MIEQPILLFLHGVGTGDPDDAWRRTLDTSLREIGYDGLDAVTVIAPKYPHSLRASDDNHPLPGRTIDEPAGESAKRNRREFDRRESAIEVLLDRHDQGTDWVLGEPLTEAALKLRAFKQASNYLKKRQIRANVLHRVLESFPQSGRLVIVGHSLGSVIAADVVRRLPAGVEVVGMVTIGSPLSSTMFHVEGLGATLKQPPMNLGWWVNFWNPLDPVTAHKGVSSVFPWMSDYAVTTPLNLKVHDAATYLADTRVARAIGYALHGAQSRDVAVVSNAPESPLDAAETLLLLALRYAYLIETKTTGSQRDRYALARREVQGTTIDAVVAHRERDRRPVPALIAALAVDLADPSCPAGEPGLVPRLSKEDAVLPLISLMSSNIIQPFEIDLAEAVRTEALEDLAIDAGLGRQFARDLTESAAAARRALSGTTNWIKWATIGVGAAALVAATGGLALAAAPGVAGAAAVTSALAAFGPGGMIGGLLTAGALVGAGGGSMALGLASPTTSAEAVEAFASTQLTGAILRQKQGLVQDPGTWLNLSQTGKELRRRQSHLETISDESATSLRELRRKLKAIDRALRYLASLGLAPAGSEAPPTRPAAADLFDRAAEAFRSVDVDGDGIPDGPKALAAFAALRKRGKTGARDAGGDLKEGDAAPCTDEP